MKTGITFINNSLTIQNSFLINLSLFLSPMKDLEILEHQEEERLEAVRRGIIEQERQRLLKEHATKLLGYLPKVCYLFNQLPHTCIHTYRGVDTASHRTLSDKSSECLVN